MTAKHTMDSRIPPRTAVTGTLVERILHDLKQPLNLIRVVAQDVRLDARKDRLDAEALPDSMAEIEQAVDEVVTRIEQMRRFIRSPQSEDRDVTARVDAACLAAVQRRCGSRGRVEVSVHIAPELPPAVVHPVYLEHALWELLDNAMWAAQQAEGRQPRIGVTAEASEVGVVVRIEDNGPGMPDEVKSRLFQPFVGQRQGGSGLGLAMAAGVLSEFGAQVGLVSTGPAGTTFEVVLRKAT